MRRPAEERTVMARNGRGRPAWMETAGTLMRLLAQLASLIEMIRKAF
jgi:hypothetical protein